MKAGIAAAIGLAGALAGWNAAAASKNDGNSLLSNCNATIRIMDGEKFSAETNEIGIGQCFGLVEGVRNTLVYLNDSLGSNLRVCWPDKGIPNGQAVRVVVKYLNDHPAELNLDQTLLTMLAYKTAYPCNK